MIGSGFFAAPAGWISPFGSLEVSIQPLQVSRRVQKQDLEKLMSANRIGDLCLLVADADPFLAWRQQGAR
jgi:hypothetical protein